MKTVILSKNELFKIIQKAMSQSLGDEDKARYVPGYTRQRIDHGNEDRFYEITFYSDEEATEAGIIKDPDKDKEFSDAEKAKQEAKSLFSRGKSSK